MALSYFVREIGGFDELWVTDGTVSGTHVLASFAHVASVDSGAFSAVKTIGARLFFVVNDGVHGQELWTTETQTISGSLVTFPTMVKDIWPGSGGSFPDELTNVNGALYFEATDGVHGQQLWKSDGTAAGTLMVKDINLGSGNSIPAGLTNFNGTLYFSADDGAHGRELWKSDGTAAGTVMVKDIDPGPIESLPGELTNVNGTLYFAADDGAHGFELWKSDGTAAGTVLVKDIDPGSGSSFPGELANFNGTLYFAANDGTHGDELWKSDGTAAGTVMVKDIDPGASDLGPPNSCLTSTARFTSWRTTARMAMICGSRTGPPPEH